MKVTLSRLFNTQNALNKLSSCNMKMSTSFKMTKVVKAVSAELSILEEKRNELIKKYGELDESGEHYEVLDDSKRDEFFKEFSDLLNVEVELSVEQISVDDLVTSKGEEIDLSTNELLQLEWLLKD